MASIAHPRRRAAVATVAYLLLCTGATLAHVLINRISEVESRADDATSAVSEALQRAEQNADEISELRDTVEDVQRQVEYR